MHAAAGLVHAADMTAPGSWYPKARSMQRTIIFHMGPTNSGKTFQALERYNAAESGVYASPLRLLAMEVWDQCNQRGTYCSLLTGQEKEEVAFSRHTACTVEVSSAFLLRRNPRAPTSPSCIDGEQQSVATPQAARGWVHPPCRHFKTPIVLLALGLISRRRHSKP
jgi:hypothetical protein